MGWVHQQMPAEGALDAATCAATRDHAWSRFTQGHAAEALDDIRIALEDGIPADDTTGQPQLFAARAAE